MWAVTQSFIAFDPLQAKGKLDNSLAAQRAVRREIENILSSYVGWYDPFCELVQNGWTPWKNEHATRN